jgi:hypothetical protein
VVGLDLVVEGLTGWEFQDCDDRCYLSSRLRGDVVDSSLRVSPSLLHTRLILTV